MEATRLEHGSLSGVVYRAEAIQLLEEVGKDSADIVFLDPPFNLGKRYSGEAKIDNRPPVEYSKWLINVVDSAINALRPGAALFVYHLPIWALRIGAHAEKHLLFRHWITVTMKNGFARGSRLYPSHYALLYFTKGKPQFFFRPKLSPLRCRTCGSLVRDYGGYRKIIEKSGINLSDVWDDLSPVRHRNRKHRSANELPMELFDRIITISGQPGMNYVDPFAGSGSGAIAALKHNLNFAVGDLVYENTQLIVDRVKDSLSYCGDKHD